jgi:hypothetical protein
MDPSLLLIQQNKALVHEMYRYKRQIAEAKKELELMRSKSREMESLVSIIQRSWSQVLLYIIYINILIRIRPLILFSYYDMYIKARHRRQPPLRWIRRL